MGGILYRKLGSYRTEQIVPILGIEREPSGKQDQNVRLPPDSTALYLPNDLRSPGLYHILSIKVSSALFTLFM